MKQSNNQKYYNFHNLFPIIKLFLYIGFPNNFLHIYNPINYLDKYIQNYKNKIYKFEKYPIKSTYNKK